MNKILGIGLVVGGGYIVAKAMGIDILNLNGGYHDPNTVSSQDDDIPSTSGTVNADNPNANSSTKLAVMELAKKDGINVNGNNTVDVWNYYYKFVRGIDAPSPEDLFPGVDRNRLYSVDEWWNAISGKGLSGISWQSGMGAIANRIDPYTTNPYMRGYGNNARPLGYETYVFRPGF